MKITVIGSGCLTCEAVYNSIKKLKEKMGFDAEVEYINDHNELIIRGIMGSPAILIDDKPVWIGTPRNEDELKKILENSCLKE